MRCSPPGRRQAFRIDRGRHLVKQDAGSRETAYGLTSLGPAQAGPEQIGELVRRHWHIENRLHYVRDFTYDEEPGGAPCPGCRSRRLTTLDEDRF